MHIFFFLVINESHSWSSNDQKPLENARTKEMKFPPLEFLLHHLEQLLKGAGLLQLKATSEAVRDSAPYNPS